MKKVFVVTGSPGAGKSTYAKSKAGKNDIIFDLDEIIKALGGTLHDDSKKCLDIALAMRTAAIKEIAARGGSWENAYFITSSNKQSEIDTLCRTMQAEEIPIESTFEQCKENILHDETRENKDHQIQLAENWHNGRTEGLSTRDLFAEWAKMVF